MTQSKCWCGGRLSILEAEGDNPSLRGRFKYNTMECAECYSPSMTPDQLVEARESLRLAIEAEGERNLDQEDIDLVKRALDRGLLIPDHISRKPIHLIASDITCPTNFNQIYAKVEGTSVMISMEDDYDNMCVHLDHKQEDELFLLLSERRNVTGKLHEKLQG